MSSDTGGFRMQLVPSTCLLVMGGTSKNYVQALSKHLASEGNLSRWRIPGVETLLSLPLMIKVAASRLGLDRLLYVEFESLKF